MAIDVWTIDTSALLEVKRCGFSEGDQMAVFKGLTDLAQQGRIAVERRVIGECGGGRYFDLPAGWATFVRGHLVHPLEAQAVYIGRVMASAAELVEQGALHDPADPWVLALALQLVDGQHDVCVVTQDRIDRLPTKLSMATACKRLKLPWRMLEDFLHDVGLP